MANVRSLNRVILVGRVGQDPEITHIPSIGRDVAKFSLATNDGYMDKNNQWKENTEWHNIVAWGPITQKIERTVSKGSMLLIEGKMKTRKWKDKNDQSRSKTEIEVTNLVVLEKSNKDSPYSDVNGKSESDSYGTQVSEDHISQQKEAQSPLPEKDINDDEFPYDESSDPF